MSSNLGPMMTLAALAATAPDERPSGETVDQQAQRIMAGINSYLSDSSLGLATGNLWQAVWVGLTQDRANLAFIAVNPSQNAYAVSLRGTQFNSLADLAEDMETGTLAQFTVGTSALLVSKGSMKAFTEITSASGLPYGSLLDALTALLDFAPKNPTIYITGHSLGGAMATMVAVYLQSQTWSNPPAFMVYTFAAPTAGLANFAAYYDEVLTNNPPNQTFRVYNDWDAVPNAWASLSNVHDNFYPAPPVTTPNPVGPAQNPTVSLLLKELAKAAGNNIYVQTNGNSPTGPNTTVLNSGYSSLNSNCCYPNTASFMSQVAYQHNSYLQLLGVNSLPQPGQPGGVPAVSGVTPNSGAVTVGTLVSIAGGGFTPDCGVDFGTTPAAIVSLTPALITVTSPASVGTADVRVTNMFGTSAVTPADQFTSPAPVAPTVSSVSPDAGPAVASGNSAYTVTVTGTGFVVPSGSSPAYTVNFGSDNPGTVLTVSLSEITVTPPATPSGGMLPVDVTVTNSLGTSVAAPPGGQFTFGAPMVTGITPASGPHKTKGNPQVTITGDGFIEGCTVAFGDLGAASVAYHSPTQISADPPLMPTAIIVNVMVTNGSQTSASTPGSLYRYY